MKIVLLIGFILLFQGCSSQKKNEKYYQEKLCKKLDGISEFRLEDKTRVDCLTEDLAIEVDWARKWAEGVGQALYYSHHTGKLACVALIVGNKDQKHLKRLEILASKYNIKIIQIEKE